MKNLSSYIQEMEKWFLSLREFGYYKENQELKLKPIQNIVYGLVSAILLAVIGVAGTAIAFYMRNGK